MFAAAVLVMVGGERMARREVETRTPIDRDRLFDFDEKLRAELERLDILYQNHLTRLAQTLSTPDMSESQAREALANVAGVLRMQTFPRKGAGKRFDRELARRMGGDLELLDHSPGSTFRWRIPAPPPSPTESTESTESTENTETP
jgi:hypothetical protein